jgi:hypothetical protein
VGAVVGLVAVVVAHGRRRNQAVAWVAARVDGRRRSPGVAGVVILAAEAAAGVATRSAATDRETAPAWTVRAAHPAAVRCQAKVLDRALAEAGMAVVAAHVPAEAGMAVVVAHAPAEVAVAHAAVEVVAADAAVVAAVVAVAVAVAKGVKR